MTASESANLTRPAKGQEKFFLDPAIWDDGGFQELAAHQKLLLMLYLMRPESAGWSRNAAEAFIGHSILEQDELFIQNELGSGEFQYFTSAPHGAPAPADQGRAGNS